MTTWLHVVPTPFECSFERFADEATTWPGMYFEMDGSFVWTGDTEGAGEGIARWQLDGMVYDAMNRIQYVELRGGCPSQEWTQLLALLHRPTASLGSSVVAHWIPEGVWVPAHDLSPILSDYREAA